MPLFWEAMGYTWKMSFFLSITESYFTSHLASRNLTKEMHREASAALVRMELSLPLSVLQYVAGTLFHRIGNRTLACTLPCPDRGTYSVY